MADDQTDQQADDTKDVDQTTDQSDADDADIEGAEDLGDAGKKALDAMKAKWRAERDRARDLARQLAEASAKPATKDDAPDPDAIRAEADRAAQAKANARIVRAEVKAAAAGKLADPGDAHRFLDLDSFEVDADGNVDSEEIADAIDELLKSKPYLAAAQGGQRRFQGSADNGARKEKPKSLAEQIEAAQKAGDTNLVFRLKARQSMTNR